MSLNEKKMMLGKKQYVQPDKESPVMVMLDKVIGEKEIHTGGANLGVVFVFPNVSPTTVAQVVKASKELKFFTNYDYVIEISGDIWHVLTPDVQEIILWHELKHLKLKEDDAGSYQFGLCDHDLKDFHDIINAHGMQWRDTIHKELVKLYVNDPKIKPKDDPEVQREKMEALKVKQDEMVKRIKV